MTTAPTTFRIAQLSDIHLGPLPAFGPRHWNVKRALGYANWVRKRVRIHRPETLALITEDLAKAGAGHVIVSGDLVNIGLPAEYAAAASWLAAIGTPHHVTVVPGNHDIYTPLSRDIGIGRWQPYFESDAYGEIVRAAAGCAPSEPFPVVRRVGDIVLIGLNSALPTPPAVAAGQLGPRQLRALAGVLTRTSEAGLARLVIVHHPPLGGGPSTRRGLKDAPALRAVLADAGAELVVHGHNHRDEAGTIATTSNFNGIGRPEAPRPIPVIGAASASSTVRHHEEPLARYQLFDFSRCSSRDGRGWRINLTIRGIERPGGPVSEIRSAVVAEPDT